MTQTVPDISPLMPMHQDPLLVFSVWAMSYFGGNTNIINQLQYATWRIQFPKVVRLVYYTRYITLWWRHQMETFSALLALCAGNSLVTGEFPTQRPVTRSFDVFFYLRLNKRLSKQSWGWGFETPSRPLWRHCNLLHYYLLQARQHNEV